MQAVNAMRALADRMHRGIQFLLPPSRHENARTFLDRQARGSQADAAVRSAVLALR